MRIISGTARGREIMIPKEVARPSTDRLREALFSILSQHTDGARVLDLFAGSGALGLECLSRGGASCDFVDASRVATQTIEKNLTKLKLPEGRVVNQEVHRFLQHATARYDLIFADPPYLKHQGDTDFIAQLLTDGKLPSLLTDDGLLILEDPPQNSRASNAQWELIDQRRYGSCGVLFYRPVIPS